MPPTLANTADNGQSLGIEPLADLPHGLPRENANKVDESKVFQMEVSFEITRNVGRFDVFANEDAIIERSVGV